MSKAISKKEILKFLKSQMPFYIIMAVFAIFFIFPYVYMVNKSLMSAGETMTKPVTFWPASFRIVNYFNLFAKNNYFAYLGNTLLIVGVNVVFVPLSASVCAYGFAKINFKGKGVVFAVVMATMMIPGTLTQVPLYTLFSALGWLNTPLPLTIPGLFGGGAVNIFLLRQFMYGIPNEMENAAKIDGASRLSRFFYLILPLCGPILLYVMVTTFTATWSDFNGPLIYLKTKESYTLAVAIYYDSILDGAIEKTNLRMAASTFMSIVPAILFFLYQNKLVDGVMVGSIKG